jgi:hypothetical protein
VTPSLDSRFEDLKRTVDDEIARARREVVAGLSQAVARMRAAKSDAEWQQAVLESGRVFADQPDALELLGTLAALTAPVSAAALTAPVSAPVLAATAEVTGKGVGEHLPEADSNVAAQRFARVKVAEIQLYQRDDVLNGRAARDLYGSLKQKIDEAREAFRERFLGNGNHTADYLHAEILHALANDDVSLMGPGYPGPLV